MAISNELYIKIGSDIRDIQRDLKILGKRMGQFSTSVDKGMKQANSSLGALRRGVNGVTGSLAKWGAAWFGIQAALSMFSRALAPLIQFQVRMVEINSLLNVSIEEFDNMKNSVVELSKRIPQTADQLVGGLYQIVSAGVDAANQMIVLEATSKAAE